jgi:hypothetical protein
MSPVTVGRRTTAWEVSSGARSAPVLEVRRGIPPWRAGLSALSQQDQYMGRAVG